VTNDVQVDSSPFMPEILVPLGYQSSDSLSIVSGGMGHSEMHGTIDSRDKDIDNRYN
jgi:hypothetical protein